MNLLESSEKIFIAGARGMVGSSIYRILKKYGFGREELGGKLFCPSRKELNLENYNEVNNWFKLNNPSIVILAAAEVGGIHANNSRPADFILKNLKIQTNLIELSFIHNVKRFLFLGSSCIYPKFAKQPIQEESLLSSSLEETNQWYAIAKIAGLKLCQSLRIQHNFDTISLMPTNLYGENDNYHPKDSHVLPAMIRKFWLAKKSNISRVSCWGTGKPLREFLFVDDLAEACLFTLNNWNPTQDKFNNQEINWLNVGSDFEISIKELALKISNIMKYEGEIIWDESKPDGTYRKKLDTTKINNLGWEAKTDLDTGIAKVVESLKTKNSFF